MFAGVWFNAGSPVYKTPPPPPKKIQEQVKEVVGGCPHAYINKNGCLCARMQWASLSHIAAHMESCSNLVLLSFMKGFNILLYCNTIAHGAVDTFYEA